MTHPRPGHRPHPHRHARVAQLVREAEAVGERPIPVIAARMGLTLTSARLYLHQARKAGAVPR